MKHSVKITSILIILFLLAQIIGLFTLQQKIDPITGEMSTVEKLGPLEIESPEELSNPFGFLYVIGAILLGTIIILFIIKFKKPILWKLWFFLAVIICLSVAFNQFIDWKIALSLAIILALFKVFKPNIYLHNITELFIYPGLAVIFVPVLNEFAIFILLILISIYDMYAVWKSKHMVALAKFQTESKVFAGLLIPYSLKFSKTKKSIKPSKQVKEIKKAIKTSSKKSKITKIKTAVLGGGDMGIPLIFTGVIMKSVGISLALIIPIFTTIALSLLLFKSKKNKFYPAMPFLTAGCLAGYIVVKTIVYFI